MKTKFESKIASGTTLAEVIFPARAGRVTALQNIIGVSDKAASALKFYKGGTPVALLADVASDATTFTVPAGSGFAANDILVIHDTVNNVVASATVSSVANNQAGTITTVTLSAAIGAAFAAGSLAFEMALAGTIAVGATTKEVLRSPGFITAGEASRRPVMARLDGTSACSIPYAFAAHQE